MPSSRRGTMAPAQRPLAVRGDVDRPYEKSRKSSSRHALDIRSPHSPPPVHMVPAEQYPPSSVYPDRSDVRDQPRSQNLPSLRTVIDLPPLQPQYGHHTAPQPSPQSPYPPNSKHTPASYGHGGDRNIVLGRPIHTPVALAAPASYFDNRMDPRNRPSSRSSTRPAATYGAVQGQPGIMSPVSTTSAAASAYYDERLAHQVNRVDVAPQVQPSDMRPEPRRGSSFGQGKHLSRITDLRASVTVAGPAAVPRCVGEQHIPGKGLCYIYEDGSFCEAVVRGEAVNPEWGLTRAGRARKRLAKACNSCREKKVKCEPGNSYRCQRCSRKGQDCQWSHYTENSPDRESYEASVMGRNIPQPPESVYEPHYPPSRMPLTPPYTVSGKASYDPVASLPDLETRQSSKRLRSESPGRAPVLHMVHSIDRPTSLTMTEMPGDSYEVQDSSMFEWETDPYHNDPARTSKLIHVYFEYRDASINCVLPRESFWHWVRSTHVRSRDEKVLLYAILALGALFCPDPELRDCGVKLAHLGRLAERDIACQHSLPLALARLHLAFFYFATGSGEQSCYFIHASFRTLNALQLNVQEGILNVPVDPALWDFGLNRVELIECRRRIFWLGYLTERHCSFASSITLFSLNPDDIFIHLPNSERHYQTGVDTIGPLFDSTHLPSSPSPTGDLGSMALSVTIATIYGDVVKNTYRAIHRPRTVGPSYQSQNNHSNTYYASTLRRLTEWEASLPNHLQYSQTNTWRNIRCGDFSTYLVLQCVHQATKLHLSRFTRIRELAPDQVRANIRHANSTARDLLALVSALARSAESSSSSSSSSSAAGTSFTSPHQHHHNQQQQQHSHPNLPNPAAFVHPIIAHAILLAADTVSAAGNLDRHLRDTIKSLSDALCIVERVAAFFRTAREQERLLRGRIRELQAFGALEEGKPTWRCEGPCVRGGGGRDADVLYGVDEAVYLEAMSEGGGWPDVRGVPGSG